jgi:hypothetical protein
MPFSRLARMPRSPRFPLTFALIVAAALVALGCGGDDAKLLPGETAREITANLDAVQQLSDEGDCLGAESAAQQVDEQIEAVQGVDPKLKRALEDGAQRLEEVISECDETETLAPTTTEEETTPAESEKEAKAREKEEEKAEKEAQKEEEQERKEEEAASEGNPSLPPQAKGEGKGSEEGKGPPVEESGETPSEDSGGVSPGSAVEGE